MKRSSCTSLLALLVTALGVVVPSRSFSEDIDLFVGATASSTVASTPNVLFIIDNSANWSSANQHWVGGVKQGQSELRALRTVVGEATDNVNAGLMLFTEGSGTNFNGGYVRYAIRQMTATNKSALQELIGDQNCVNGPNSLNGTPNCIFRNFDAAAEKVGTSKNDYSATLFEAFKYFGGHTSPAHALDNVAGTPVDASHFGAIRYGGNPDPKSDPGAFNPASQTTTYSPPILSTDSCAKNYIVFIGNGFPGLDSPGSLLSGVGGNTAQLAMPQFSTNSTVVNTTIGNACGTGNNENQRLSNCTANIPQSLKDANPADTYTCLAGTGVVDATACPGNNTLKYSVQASKTVITVTPTGQYAVPASNVARYADEWTKYLISTDVSAALNQQNVKTYTIDVFKDQQDANESALLFSMAKAGGGQYYQATSESDIINAMRDILIQIQAENSVFAAAALPVSATNRAQNENQVFFGMFRPTNDATPRWYGNLKRYQVGVDSTGSLFTADKDGQNAISAATGFFTPCADSFWTVDSGPYWYFAGNAPGQCTSATTSVYSDLPDGAQVEKGGAGEVLRRGNNPTASAPFTVNRNMYTCTTSASCPAGTGLHMVDFNATNVSQIELGVTDATTQQNIVNYTYGNDVWNETAAISPSTTAPRPSIHGDIVHARPLPVNYNSTSTDTYGVVAYYGTNDGTFRAVHTTDGKELWSFIAPEHHSKLRRLSDNGPRVLYPGSTDTAALPKDYFFDGTAGLYQNADNSKIWIFPTQRRGGRMMYAFDVTCTTTTNCPPTTPVLKWRLGCPNLTNDTGCGLYTVNSAGATVYTGSVYTSIGETWSVPNVARIKGYNSGNSPVIVTGGGYDACEDTDSPTPPCSSAKGRKVYVIDADTGTLIRSFDTVRSVPADVALMDRDFDGMVDHAYVADTGGNLYRLDFVDPTNPPTTLTSTNWQMHKIATVASGSGRKFLFPPSVLFAGTGSQAKAYLAIGSGDRERPLVTNYPYLTPIANRFYLFVDLFTDTDSEDSNAISLDGSLLASNPDSSTCITPSATSRGWRMDLPGTGEQTVTSALIAGGRIVFNTHRAVPSTGSMCTANLGEARGYNVGLLCGTNFSVVYTGIGLAISPVQGTVTLPSGRVQTFVLGGTTSPSSHTPFSPGKVAPAITQKRSRIYWYNHGDK